MAAECLDKVNACEVKRDLKTVVLDPYHYQLKFNHLDNCGDLQLFGNLKPHELGMFSRCVGMPRIEFEVERPRKEISMTDIEGVLNNIPAGTAFCIDDLIALFNKRFFNGEG